jgi:hypothetical protein
MRRLDITLSASTLRAGLLIVGLGLVLGLGLIGVVSSPVINGHPVLLTRERLAIKRYLDAAGDWSVRLGDVAHQFDGLFVAPALTPASPLTPTQPISISAASVPTTTLPTAVPLPPQTPLAFPAKPASQPVGLYDRAHAAEQAVGELQTIETEQQRIEIPAALSGLHTLAQAALQTTARWAAALLDDIGAPSPANQAAVESERQTALAALTAFRDALARPGTGDTQP